MLPDYGDFNAIILISYGVTFAIVIGLIVHTVLRKSRHK